jgi:hypothetical protein
MHSVCHQSTLGTEMVLTHLMVTSVTGRLTSVCFPALLRGNAALHLPVLWPAAFASHRCFSTVALLQTQAAQLCAPVWRRMSRYYNCLYAIAKLLPKHVAIFASFLQLLEGHPCKYWISAGIRFLTPE